MMSLSVAHLRFARSFYFELLRFYDLPLHRKNAISEGISFYGKRELLTNQCTHVAPRLWQQKVASDSLSSAPGGDFMSVYTVFWHLFCTFLQILWMLRAESGTGVVSQSVGNFFKTCHFWHKKLLIGQVSMLNPDIAFATQCTVSSWVLPPHTGPHDLWLHYFPKRKDPQRPGLCTTSASLWDN